MTRDTETERHNNCFVKMLTAPQANFVTQFLAAGRPDTRRANSSTCCFVANRPEPAAKHAFVPRCLSESEEVIYVLFGYGSLVWRIGSREREGF